ncbi:MAG TPA: ATP-binding protein [Actinomycetota bacterium]|nr:ATP-binding protein [Actinomycetota bacterium]
MTRAPGARGRRVRWADLSLRAKGVVVVAIPLAALLVTVTGFVVSAERTEDVERQTAEATHHRHVARNLVIAMVDAESAVRGYLLTGREAFLDPYAEAVASAALNLERLGRLFGSEPGYEDALRRIERLAEERLAILIELRSQPSAARRLVLLTRGLEVRQELREQLDAIVAQENADLADARAAADDARTMSLVIIAACFLLGLLGGVLAMGAFSSGVAGRVRRLEDNAGRLAEGEPLASLPGGDDEIGRLGRAMEATAGRLARAREVIEERNRELERSNKELEQFAYIASHDLQEPLRIVAGYADLLARRYRGKLDGDADEFIGYMVEGVGRMQALINDLLQYSRVGTKGREPQPTDVQQALDQALRNLGKTLDESGARVEAEPLPTVPADEGQLVQLFQNLIGNAVKFQGDEPPRVRVEAERRNGEWEFSVADNGIGIDPDYGEQIFEIFQRLHTREEFAGTGIGLAICRKIVDRHGGRIWVESTPGHGSTFRFTIPAERRAHHDH